MGQVTIISDDVRTVDAHSVGPNLTVPPSALRDAMGWDLKPEGLCRGDVCVPVRDREALFVDGGVDIAAVAAALGRPAVIDADAGIAAIAMDGEARRQALHALVAPSFTLNDLDGHPHQLEQWRGRKKLLIAFSSW